jgi:hypothetical protein
MKALNENELSMVSGGVKVTLDEAKFIANSLVDSENHTFVYKNAKYTLSSPDEYLVIGDLMGNIISQIEIGSATLDCMTDDFGARIKQETNSEFTSKVHNLQLIISHLK